MRRRESKSMTTLYTHAVAGLAIAAMSTCRRRAWPYWLLAGLLPVLPDLDTLSMSSYSSIWGHRGFTHSLTFALATGFLATALSGWYLRVRFWHLAAVFCTAAASHCVLDMLTKGGNGVALWWPFSEDRVGSWGPIPVADIGFDWPDPRRSRALSAELLYIWLPAATLVGLVTLFRLASRPRQRPQNEVGH
jgi:inner membrane protein